MNFYLSLRFYPSGRIYYTYISFSEEKTSLSLKSSAFVSFNSLPRLLVLESRDHFVGRKCEERAQRSFVLVPVLELCMICVSNMIISVGDEPHFIIKCIDNRVSAQVLRDAGFHLILKE